MLFIRRWFRYAKTLTRLVVKYCQKRARSEDYYDKILVAKIKEKIRLRRVRKNPESLPKQITEYCSYGVSKQGYFYKNGVKMYHKNEVFQRCKDKDTIIYFNMNDKCIGPYKVIKVNEKKLILMSRFHEDFIVTK